MGCLHDCREKFPGTIFSRTVFCGQICPVTFLKKVPISTRGTSMFRNLTTGPVLHRHRVRPLNREPGPAPPHATMSLHRVALAKKNHGRTGSCKKIPGRSRSRRNFSPGKTGTGNNIFCRARSATIFCPGLVRKLPPIWGAGLAQGGVIISLEIGFLQSKTNLYLLMLLIIAGSSEASVKVRSEPSFLDCSINPIYVL